VWFNVEPLTTSGLWDHYVNSGADKNADTIANLNYLGFVEVAESLRTFNERVFPNGVPEGANARMDVYMKVPEEKIETWIDEMDDPFWAISEQLEERLTKHIIEARL
jgi:hypothetical protein